MTDLSSKSSSKTPSANKNVSNTLNGTLDKPKNNSFFNSTNSFEEKKTRLKEGKNIEGVIRDAIKSSYKDILTVKNSLSSSDNKDSKLLFKILSKIESTEELSKKFLNPDKNGVPTTEDARNLLKSYRKINSLLVSNENKKIGSSTLGQIVRDFQDDQNKRFIYEKSLDSRLNDIKNEKEEKGEKASITDLLISNPASVAASQEGVHLTSSLLSGIAPSLGLFINTINQESKGLRSYFSDWKEKRKSQKIQKRDEEKALLINAKQDFSLKRKKLGEDSYEEADLSNININNIVKTLVKEKKESKKKEKKEEKTRTNIDLLSVRQKLSNFIKDSGKIISKVATKTLNLAGSAFKNIGSALSSVGSSIAGFISSNPIPILIGALGLLAYSFKDEIANLAKGIFNKISDLISDAVEWIKDKVSSVLNFTSNLPKKLISSGSNFISNSIEKTESFASKSFSSSKEKDISENNLANSSESRLFSKKESSNILTNNLSDLKSNNLSSIESISNNNLSSSMEEVKDIMSSQKEILKENNTIIKERESNNSEKIENNKYSSMNTNLSPDAYVAGIQFGTL